MARHDYLCSNILTLKIKIKNCLIFTLLGQLKILIKLKSYGIVVFFM